MAAFPSQNRPIAPTAIGYYEQAIAKDPGYALAYAGMSDTYLAVERNNAEAPKLGADLLAKAKTAVARALELDPMLSEAHSAMGSILAREYAWPDAEHHFRRAIDLDQNNALAHLGLGVDVLLMQGRVDEALDEVRRAVRLDPLSPSTNTEYGRALFWARQYDAAVDQLRIAIALDPGRARPYGLLARTLFAQGRTTEALTVFDEAITRGALLPRLSNTDLACVAARSGRRDDQVVAMLQREFMHKRANEAAKAYACLGNAPETVHYLEKALAAREPNLAELLQDPYIPWMHADDQFAAFRRQLKLPARSSSPLSR
jgi:Tfp pilus assembly protein PilF